RPTNSRSKNSRKKAIRKRNSGSNRATSSPCTNRSSDLMEISTSETTGTALHDEKVNLRHYWHVILERRWLVIAAFCSVFALCLIYLFKATRIYQATSRIQIDRESDNVLNIKDVFSVDGREQDYLQTQYKNLQSRTLIESVVSKLKLD